MTEPTEMKVFKGGKKEPCIYCGGEPHAAILACPRIAAVYISPEGYVEGLEFREEWKPDLAG